jgi:hypothetical protein
MDILTRSLQLESDSNTVLIQFFRLANHPYGISCLLEPFQETYDPGQIILYRENQYRMK